MRKREAKQKAKTAEKQAKMAEKQAKMAEKQKLKRGVQWMKSTDPLGKDDSFPEMPDLMSDNHEDDYLEKRAKIVRRINLFL